MHLRQRCDNISADNADNTGTADNADNADVLCLHFSRVPHFPPPQHCPPRTPYRRKALAFSPPGDTLKHCPCIVNNTCHTARPTPPPGPAPPAMPWADAVEKYPPHHHGGNCQYDTLAGELWDMRLKQLIVANGVAVVQANPYADDGWLAYDSDPGEPGEPTWTNGTDKPFLTQVFAKLAAGDLG